MPLENSQGLEYRARVLEKVRDFGRELDDLLNNTVATDIRLMARWREQDNDGRLGFKMDKAGIPSTIAFPGPNGPSCHLYILFRFLLNEHDYLVTTKSALRLYLDENQVGTLFRYEYLRDDPDPYPNPHLHVEGRNSDAWSVLNDRTGQKKGLRQLHFPLGGKRYRPSIEDFLEFLFTEGYVVPKEGWEDAIAIYRGTYHDNQLGAAVAANPEIAARILSDKGYRVKKPKS